MSFFYTKENQETASFGDHLEDFRWLITRVLLAISLVFLAIFNFHDFMFNQIVFQPISSDFPTYKIFDRFAFGLQNPDSNTGNFQIKLINLELTGQFMAHMSVAATIAIILALPYILFEIWMFITPALYPNERKYVIWIFISSTILFYLGCLVSYYLIFPLTIRFLGTYQVSELVPNQISLESYLGTLFILVFSMGLMFEMPVLVYFFSRIGILTPQMIKNVRSYAYIILLILSAIITPTTDPFTLFVVAIPLYLLYEFSILVCKSK